MAAVPGAEVTDLDRSVDQLLSGINNRALFIVISDFFTDLDSIKRALARFRHRRHDVILLQTLDRQEMQFDFTQPAPFKGLEDEGRLRVDPRITASGDNEILSMPCSTRNLANIGYVEGASPQIPIFRLFFLALLIA